MQRNLVIFFIFSSSLCFAMDNPYEPQAPSVQMVINQSMFNKDFKKHLKHNKPFRQQCLMYTIDNDQNRLVHFLAQNLRKDDLEALLPYCNYKHLMQRNSLNSTPINLVNLQSSCNENYYLIEDCRELIQDRIDQIDPDFCINKLPPCLRLILCCECGLDSDNDDENEVLIKLQE